MGDRAGCWATLSAASTTSFSGGRGGDNAERRFYARADMVRTAEVAVGGETATTIILADAPIVVVWDSIGGSSRRHSYAIFSPCVIRQIVRLWTGARAR